MSPTSTVLETKSVQWLQSISAPRYGSPQSMAPLSVLCSIRYCPCLQLSGLVCLLLACENSGAQMSHENTTPGSSATGKVIDWHPQLLPRETALYTYKGRTITIHVLPANDWVAGTLRQAPPTRCGNSPSACFGLKASQEPDIKVALLNQVPPYIPELSFWFSGIHWLVRIWHWCWKGDNISLLFLWL